MLTNAPPGYELIRPLGSGASGAVFLAQQLNPKRLVAIKMLHIPGDELARRRLMREAETLAALHHPAIVSVLAAGEMPGSTSPVSYIVMEYVEGMPLSRSDETQQAPLNRKVELIVELCEALFHAHQRGILHRDIKPDNLLIDPQGKPHLLDFGIAQALDGADRHTRLTRREDILGTLAYMSPEQLSGEDAGVQSDLYALGVLAFELLTGKLPIEISGMSIPRAMEAKLEQEPTPLRRLLPDADKTLEAILSKALARTPNNRYLSVRQLADDLNAWLHGDPVQLDGNTAVYTLGVLLRKHRLAAISLTIFVASALLAAMIASTFAIREAKARKQAEEQAERAEVINQILTRILVSADPDQSQGKDLTVLTVVENAAPVIAELSSRRPLIGAELRILLADVLRNLGELERSESLLMAVKSLVENAQQAELRVRWTTSLASTWRGQGKAEQALELLHSASDEANSLPANQLAKAAYLAEVGSGLIKLGKPEAPEHLRRILDMPLGDSAEAKSLKLDTMHNLALYLREVGGLDESERLISIVVAERTQQYGADHPTALYSLNVLGSVLSLKNDHAGAERIYRQVLAGRLKAYGESHLQVINVETNLLNALISQKKFDEADRLSRSVLDKMASQPDEYFDQRINVGNMRAYLLEDLGRLPEAEALYLETLALLKSQSGISVQNYALENNLGMLLMSMDRLPDARARFETVLSEMEGQGATEHIFYAITRNNLGECLTRLGEYELARQHLSESLDSLMQKFGADHPRVKKAETRLANLQQAEASL